MEMNFEEQSKTAFEQAKALDLAQLLSGLTILVKDTADFIHTNGLKDTTAENFRQAYLDVLNHDRYYWAAFGPDLHKSLADAGMPTGFAKNAANCILDLSALTNEEIIQEWTRAAGWFFLKTYSQQLRSVILEPHPNVETLKTKLIDEEEPDKPWLELISKLAKQGNQASWFLYPLMLYFVLLLKTSDFITLK